MYDIPVTENRKLCEMYRVLLCAHAETGRVAFKHYPTEDQDELARDYIALQYCVKEGYVTFLKKRGPEFAGDPSQTISTYVITRSGERFLARYRKGRY